MKTYVRLGVVSTALVLVAGVTSAQAQASGSTNGPGDVSSAIERALAVRADLPNLFSAKQPLALSAVKNIKVKGRAPKTGYSGNRAKLFGTAWYDLDRNGCDTRNDMLRRDFKTVIIKLGTYGCKVIGGTWRDPYSNISYTFSSQPSIVQVDHIVSLSDAWQKGAQQMSFEKRRQLANDPLNLVMTMGSLNSKKSDNDAASWLPPYKAYRCKFVARQVAVKRKYGLWMTSAEKAKILALLSNSSCAGLRLPTSSARP